MWVLLTIHRQYARYICKAAFYIVSPPKPTWIVCPWPLALPRCTWYPCWRGGGVRNLFDVVWRAFCSLWKGPKPQDPSLTPQPAGGVWCSRSIWGCASEHVIPSDRWDALGLPASLPNLTHENLHLLCQCRDYTLFVYRVPSRVNQQKSFRAQTTCLC